MNLIANFYLHEFNIFILHFIELNNIILFIKESNIKDECVDFALKAKDAWWLGNHVELFSLYKIAPKMASYLMDMFLARERNNFYLAIAKSYVYKQFIIYKNNYFSGRYIICTTGIILNVYALTV